MRRVGRIGTGWLGVESSLHNPSPHFSQPLISPADAAMFRRRDAQRTSAR
jgi:hypothetical protein